ncbi:MAG: thiamine diphosphokinase [Chloroflexi bacterium]|nr:thiamine diphosphokinase [Chloroflexota bacterium]
MSKVLVIANGNLVDVQTCRQRIGEWQPDLVIGVDGGTRHAFTLGLHPDVIVGDLDSLPEQDLPADVRIERSPAEKDETDLELALLYARRQQAAETVLIGALGGRLDMSLANLLLLTQPALNDMHIQVWYGTQTARLIRPPGQSIPAAPGDTLSLIPLVGDALRVTTHGLKYPLNDEPLHYGPARGISNIFTHASAAISLQEGLLFAVHTPGRAE